MDSEVCLQGIWVGEHGQKDAEAVGKKGLRGSSVSFSLGRTEGSLGGLSQGLWMHCFSEQMELSQRLGYQGGVLMVSKAHTGVDNERECEGRSQGWRGAWVA